MEVFDDPQLKGLSERLSANQDKWRTIVSSLSSRLKNISTLPDLQGEIFSQRQDAVDYHTTILTIIAKRGVPLKQKQGERYTYYKNLPESYIKFKTETAINTQVSSDLAYDQCVMDLLEIHAKYMEQIIKTIDGLISSIYNRIRIEEIVKGIK